MTQSSEIGGNPAEHQPDTELMTWRSELRILERQHKRISDRMYDLRQRITARELGIR